MLLEARRLVTAIAGRAGGQPLDLRIEAGQTWGILGPNGVGKTTLLHTLAGHTAPQSGEVLLNSVPLSSHSKRQIALQVGVVFQNVQDDFPATVLEATLLGRHPHLRAWEMESADDLELARAAMARVGVEHLLERQLATLSGGERQRVAIATVLAQAPSLWLVDEPTNHLDLRHQVAVMKLLAERARDGCGVVMCLHDINHAARWCDHVLLLFAGGEARWGPAPELLKTEILERLYDQTLAAVTIDGTSVFIPR